MESVGNDLTIALRDKRARQQALDASTEPLVPSVPPRKTLREHISQFAAKKDGLTKTERRRANAWRSFLNDYSKWGQEHIDDFQREHFDVFRKHLGSKEKKPRTRNNLLSNLLTVLRGHRAVGSGS